MSLSNNHKFGHWKFLEVVFGRLNFVCGDVEHWMSGFLDQQQTTQVIPNLLSVSYSVLYLRLNHSQTAYIQIVVFVIVTVDRTK